MGYNEGTAKLRDSTAIAGKTLADLVDDLDNFKASTPPAFRKQLEDAENTDGTMKKARELLKNMDLNID